MKVLIRVPWQGHAILATLTDMGSQKQKLVAYRMESQVGPGNSTQQVFHLYEVGWDQQGEEFLVNSVITNFPWPEFTKFEMPLSLVMGTPWLLEELEHPLQMLEWMK